MHRQVNDFKIVFGGAEKQVVITGIGLVSSLGEGWQQNWRALTASPVARVIDEERFAPYPIHPLPEIDWSTQIAKRGDLRQMDAWQRLGVHAAGLALDDAGMKGDEALCGTMDMTVTLMADADKIIRPN